MARKITLGVKEVYQLCEFTWEQGAAQTQASESHLVDLGTITVNRGQVISLIQGAKGLPHQYERGTFQGIPMIALHQNVVQHKECPQLWVVKTTWNSVQWLDQMTENPSARPVRITTGTHKLQIAPIIDFDGLPIATTAGEPIGYNHQASFPSYTFAKNYATYPEIGHVRDLVNSKPFSILGVSYDKWQLFIPDVDVSAVQYETNGNGGKYTFYEMSCTVYARTDGYGWRTRLLNAGFHERRCLNPTTPTKVGNKIVFKPTPFRKRQYILDAILLGEGTKKVYPSRPVLLDSNGRAFRVKLPGDDKVTGNRGPVIAMQNLADTIKSEGISQEEWANAYVERRLLNDVNFSDFLPGN